MGKPKPYSEEQRRELVKKVWNQIKYFSLTSLVPSDARVGLAEFVRSGKEFHYELEIDPKRVDIHYTDKVILVSIDFINNKKAKTKNGVEIKLK